MTKSSTLMALGKVIIAAAWADGQISPEEVNSLKDLLFRLRDLNARDWARLEMYFESPVGEEEREQLVADLQRELGTPEDKALAIAALEDMIQADGVVTEDERAVADEIHRAIASVDVSLIGRLGRLVRGSVERRSQAAAQARNREAGFEDFVRNRVFYVILERMGPDETALEALPEDELRKLSLAGGLMAWVAHVDREVTETEFARMVEALQRGWDLAKPVATFVARVAESVVSDELDYYRLTREFYASTNRQERVHFLDVLFAMAEADGYVSHEEIEEIRLIARTLKLTHREFIAAKLKIPRERRSS